MILQGIWSLTIGKEQPQTFTNEDELAELMNYHPSELDQYIKENMFMVIHRRFLLEGSEYQLKLKGVEELENMGLR